MLRTCAAAAAAAGRVCVFLEPITFYHTRNLHDRADGGWLVPYPPPMPPAGPALALNELPA